MYVRKKDGGRRRISIEECVDVARGINKMAAKKDCATTKCITMKRNTKQKLRKDKDVKQKMIILKCEEIVLYGQFRRDES